MTRCACKGAELSCIIGNIFTELRPPCDMCGGEAVTIHGITPTGRKQCTTIKGGRFPSPAIHSGDKYRIADTGALPAGMAEVIHGKEIF